MLMILPTAGTLAVVGFPIDIGARVDPLLYQVLSQTDKIPTKGNEIDIGPLSFNSITNALKSGNVYRYVFYYFDASSTSCSENMY